MPDRPNILFFLCDQLRAFEVGCYGGTHVRTPNMDRLAAEGTRFVHAVSNNPICTPARSIMLSGEYSRTCTGMLGNVHDNPPNPERVRLVDPTLPETLREAGYRTALVGKWHVDPQPRLVGFDRTVYPDFEHTYYGQRYWDETGRSWTVDDFGPDYELATLEAFLDEPRDEPFFVFHNIGQPHQPIGPGHMPERYTTMYDPARVPLRPNVPDELDPDNARHWYNIYTSAAYFWRHVAGQAQDPADLVDDAFSIRDLTALYCGATTLVDDYLGHVLKALEQRGLLENTILVFTSDHGDNLGSHGRFNKAALIEESIRIPLLVRDPRAPDGIAADGGVASLVDVLPTLLDLAGVAAPDCVQGTSLAPVVRGEPGAVLPDAACIETHGVVGIRTATHLLGIGFDEASRTAADAPALFYDLERDPFELANLAATDEEAGVRAALEARLRAWDAGTPWLDAPPPSSIHDHLARSGWVDEKGDDA
ncbi:MAG: sulfatase-like hydrolase/transferase [Planctomycetota bacterium]